MFPYNWYYFNQNMYYPMDMEFNPYYSDLDGFNEDISNTISEPQGDPPPILTNNPPSTAIVLRKECTGYPNYGNPSGNADILYTGNTGNWTFDIPPYLSASLNRFRRVELIIRGALDDHYNTPEDRYTATINVNGVVARRGDVPFVHGRPAGQIFNNWNNLVINVTPNNIRRNNRVTIRNTSNAGDTDFIAIDWIEWRFYL